jgi:pSer/pThr/pTyr-binding forkhead associated (FHA) protein
MNTEGSWGQPGPEPARRQATVIESVEEIRAQLRPAATVREERPVAPAAPPSSASSERRAATVAEARPDDTQPFRPAMRPPMALLTVLDDGDDSGEVVRVRGNTFVIGRVEGDLVIPHDNGISGRHAELSRRFEDGVYTWFLKDLKSTNGTFVRASNVTLHHDQELLVGARRFRFEAPQAPAGGDVEANQPVNATRKWAVPAEASATVPAPAHSVLVDVSQALVTPRTVLKGPELWIGRDASQCAIVVDDPTADRKHARVYRDEKSQRWVVANNRSRNGIWARVQEVSLGRGAFFQCGEQRFLLKVL